MLNFKRFLCWIVLVIGGIFGTLMFPDFSVAQDSWPTQSELSTKGKSFSFLMPNYSLYFYVLTEPNKYTIHFDANGGSWIMTGMSMIYDNTWVNLPLNEFTRDWYSFMWWSRRESGDVEYLNGAEVRNLTYVESGEVTLYAQWWWWVVPYIIEYYQEEVDGTWFVLIGSGIEYGPVWPYIITTGQEYTWFTLQTWAEVSIVSGWTVPYYYTRNPYDLTIVDRGNTSIITWIKYWADIPLPADPEWSWNTFDGWDNLPSDWKMPANNLVITSTWTYGAHTITFDTNWWTEIDPITKDYGEAIDKPENPTREWYEFVRWEPDIPDTMPYDDIVIKAIWKESSEGKWKWWSGRWGWWWGGWWSSDSPSWGEEHWTSETQNQPGRWMVDLDTFFAYMWAHDMWIIDTSWEDSDPDGYVTRWDMAQMVVKFTEKVLERDIPSTIPSQCAWWDLETERKSTETKLYAQKACALWVMWIRMRNFMPNKILDRAEFGTILSRLLWWDRYDVVDATKTKLYYTKHLNALSERKIMTQIENPEAKKELRKWAWLMLMRSRIQERRE